MIQRSSSRGGAARASRCAIEMPAGSLPWMQPTRRVLRGESKSPVSIATMGRPRTDRPSVTMRLPLGSERAAAGQAVGRMNSAATATAIAQPWRSSMPAA